MGAGAFANCDNLLELSFPACLTNISQGGLVYTPKNKPYLHIYIYATTPPTFGNNANPFSYNYITLYVPAESVDTYKEASGWSRYADKIQAMPTIQ
jgi:hypothetical protein